MKQAKQRFNILFDLNGVLLIKNDSYHIARQQPIAMIDMPKYRVVNLAANIRLLKECKEAGHFVYVVSNMSKENFHILQKNPQAQSLLSLFDEIILTDNLPARKPTPEAFTAACKHHHLLPAACIMIDDKQENLEGALQAGIPRTILCEDFNLDIVRNQLIAYGALSSESTMHVQYPKSDLNKE